MTPQPDKMVLSDRDEKDFATMQKVALSQLVAEMQSTGASTPIILVRTAEGKIERLPFPRELGRIMNDGRAKDILFDALRSIVRDKGFTAFCFATEAWGGKQTAAGSKVSKEEWDKATRQRGFQQAVDLGWVERKECLLVAIQTAELIRNITQVFERDDEKREITFVGEPEIWEAPQSDFGGRQKMYGDLKEENLS